MLRALAREPISVALLIAGGLLLLYVGISLGVQVYLPADGALLTELAPSGVSVVNLLAQRPGGLQAGDQILAVGRRAVWDWVDAALTGQPGPSWHVGQVVTYRLIREGQVMDVPITLMPLPVGRLPVLRLGAYLLALLSLAVSAYVLLARPHDRAARVLFLLSVGLMLPLTLHFQTAILVTPWLLIADLVVKAVGRSLLASSMLHLFLVFPLAKWRKGDHEPSFRWLHLINPLFSISIGQIWGSTPTGRLVLSLQWNFWICLAMMVGGLAALVHTYLTTRRAAVRSQIRWVVWGGVVGFSPYFFLTGLPEAVTGRPWLPIEVTAFFVTAVPITMGIAIVRYRLFDIDGLIRRSLFYALFLLILTGCYLALTAIFYALVRTITTRPLDAVVVFLSTLLVTSAFWLLHRPALRLSMRLLDPGRVDAARLLTEISEKLSVVIHLQDVRTMLTRIIPERIGVRGAELLIPGESDWGLGSTDGRSRLLAWEKIWEAWRTRGGQPILFSALPDWLDMSSLVSLVGERAELALPLVAGDQLVGLWCLEPYMSGRSFDSAEMRVLNTLARQAAVAVQNGRLVRQLEVQSQWLVQEVRNRTQDLEDERNRLQVILENMADGLLVTDLNGRVRLVNAAFARIVGRPAAAVSEQPLLHVLNSATLNDLLARSAQDPGRVIAARFNLGDLSLQALTCTLRDRSSAITVLRDVTHEVEVDRIKSEFISTVSHELRTPMTSVLGFAKLSLRAFDNVIRPVLPADKNVAKAAQRVNENLNIVVSEGERLTRLINDVLDIAKMEEGKVEWHDRPVSIYDVASQTVAVQSQEVQDKGLTLINQVPPDLPLLLADPDRVRQVLINLVTNAVKFTEKGQITIAARILEGDEAGLRAHGLRPNGPMMQVTVSDTGIGIAEKHLPRLFARFQQVGGDVLTDKPKGTGLGLAICREIVTHYGGAIWVESVVGQGSTFIFVLPLSLQEDA